jgi:hypothetical protein
MSSSLNDDGLSPRNADSLLRNIMSEYSRSNQKFVLPLADASAMDEIKFCIEKLLELGNLS